ncbi:MAG: type VI secretion system contractile sheath large subunit [Proteobacteria bacterium]|nr:type VI secretion system contractile sheath large subunit [Pseudomonadota bacterium]
MADPTQAPGTTTSAPAGNFLDQMIQTGKLARDPSQVPYARQMVQEFLNQIQEQEPVSTTDCVAFINQRIQAIDTLLSNQINLILHDPQFSKLEGSWRGLNYLVMNTFTGTELKLRVLHATKEELLDDLQKAVEFDQSQLFKKIYEEEYGTFGGNPYSCLVGDYYFGPNPQDMAFLSKMSGVAAAAFAPFIAAADPTMFNLDTFTNLGVPRDLASIFDSVEYAEWNALRQTEDSRYIVLTLPRVLMRLPYGPNTVPVDGMNFVEDVTGTDNSKFCWGNTAYAYGQRITNAFFLYNWTAAIRGVEGGGLVEGLPAYTFKTTEGDIALKCPTEIAITDRREKELSDLGFVALCYCKGTNKAAFFGAQTIQQPIVYNTAEANSNAQLSARITYMLAACRFAHYIKSIMRDKIGSFMTKDNVENYLQTWIANYVLLNDNAPEELKAEYPLREARVDVFDVPGSPGNYKATVFLRPHFQLEELTASLRLVATLPPPAGG